MALTILSGGLLVPSFIASIRELKLRRLIAALNVLAILTVTIGFVGGLLWLVTLVLCFVLKEKSKPNQKNEEVIQIELSNDAQQVVVSPQEDPQDHNSLSVAYQNPDHEDFEDGNSSHTSNSSSTSNLKMGFLEWLKFVISINPKIRRHEALLKESVKVNEAMKNALEEFNTSIKNISSERFSTDVERNIFELDGCLLIEVRKRARVTHRESTYSGSSRVEALELAASELVVAAVEDQVHRLQLATQLLTN